MMEILQTVFTGLAISSYAFSHLTILFGMGEKPIERANNVLLSSIAAALISVALEATKQ